jgi:hypothetical protein
MNTILLILGLCILGASLFLTVDSIPGPAYSEKEMGNVQFLSCSFRGKDHCKGKANMRKAVPL